MQLHRLRGRTPSAQAAPGNGAVSQAMPVPGPAPAGPAPAAQLCVMAGLLAGLWAAISPWCSSSARSPSSQPDAGR